MSVVSNVKARAALLAVTAALMASATTACASNSQSNAAGDPVAIYESNDSGFNGTLVDPPLQPPKVVLRDTHGEAVNLAQRTPDEVTALFFGFTHCADVCPTTMADLAAARRQLPPGLAQKVVVVFITVDPRRDTPPVLQRWLSRYDRDFVGLIGATRLVHQAERSLYGSESRIEPSQAHPGHAHVGPSRHGATYKVSHTGAVYVWGPDGQSLIYTGGTTADQYAQDFARLFRTQ